MAYNARVDPYAAYRVNTGRGGAMTEMIIEYLTRNVVIVPILLFLLGMLAGVTLTWIVMRK